MHIALKFVVLGFCFVEFALASCAADEITLERYHSEAPQAWAELRDKYAGMEFRVVETRSETIRGATISRVRRSAYVAGAGSDCFVVESTLHKESSDPNAKSLSAAAVLSQVTESQGIELLNQHYVASISEDAVTSLSISSPIANSDLHLLEQRCYPALKLL